MVARIHTARERGQDRAEATGFPDRRFEEVFLRAEQLIARKIREERQLPRARFAQVLDKILGSRLCAGPHRRGHYRISDAY